jgi:hypothetical protein
VPWTPRRVCRTHFVCSWMFDLSACRPYRKICRNCEPTLNISYCPLLPTRVFAKCLPIIRMIGRGGGDRTRAPFEFPVICDIQTAIGTLPPCC